MATQIQLRRGTTVQHSTFTGAVAEITFDTDKETVVTHDGSTAGGFPLATETQVNDRLQVANANVTFVTKAVAVSSNNAVVALVNDRLQVANANQTFETKAVALAANNAQNSLILDRLQVSNAASLFVNVSGDTMSGALAMGTNKITGLGDPTQAQDAATKTYVDTEVAGIVDAAPETLNTLNELAAALGDDSNFASTTAASLGTKAANTYVNQTFETKSVALSANNAQNSLINDRIQVANARIEFLQSSNTSITNDASSITTTQSNVDLSDEALVNPAGFITLDIGGTNYKIPFYS